MSEAIAFSDSSLVVWLTRFSVLSITIYIFTRFSQFKVPILGVVATLSCITPLALSWLLTVTRNVPEPYLDEIFHIPQAQVYCEGRYLEWDDKITTPPGLYLSTIVYNQLLRFPCSVYNLRAFNVFIVSCISVLVLVCKANSTSIRAKLDGSPETLVHNLLTGINVALFPVLFFFSGLYYTDPASTVIVLLAYTNHLTRVGKKPSSFLNDVYSLALGILALGFRQTNIFWVVIYMGGLEVIHSIKTLNPEPTILPKFQTVSEQIMFYVRRYAQGDIHDPSLSLSLPIDIIVCIVSIGTAAVFNLPTVLRRFIWPHGIILATFAAFVAWNGGVVLGDKSNHVATLHLAQMLYIWPFFAFFSAPLFIPHLLNRARTVYQTLASQARQQSSTGLFSRIPLSYLAITTLISCSALVIALLIVRFNTIIHPFTLADNRHYVFYVFRYSILRAWWIRYALAPVYVVCAWLCWGALHGSGEAHPAREKWIRSPFVTTPPPDASPSTHPGTAKGVSGGDNGVSDAEAGLGSPPTSTVLMLLLATTLSLMTAPLVEPRYFILPWLFWRLLVPATPMPSLSSGTNRSKQRVKPSSDYASVLFLETAWFLLINAATMYVFVTRPFYWRAPDGTLQDEGRIQRFMW